MATISSLGGTPLLLGVIHFIWRVKKDMGEPTLYAIVLGALLLIRLVTYVRSRLSASATT